MTRPCVFTVRADASPPIGYGHHRRTLAAANVLSVQSGCRVRYLISDESDSGLVEREGFEVLRTEARSIAGLQAQVSPADGPVLIDSYQVTEADLLRLRSAGFRIALWEDGCRLSRYPVDLLVDCSAAATGLPYRERCDGALCLGPAYFPVRREFLCAAPATLAPRPVRRVVVTCGGSDPEDATSRLLEMLVAGLRRFEVLAVLGPGYQGSAEVYAGPGVRVVRDPPDFAALLASADTVVSAAGVTALEACVLGCVLVLVSLTDDQAPVAAGLAAAGAAVSIGRIEDLTEKRLMGALIETSKPGRRSNLQTEAKRLVDGRGADRLATALAALCPGARREGR